MCYLYDSINNNHVLSGGYVLDSSESAADYAYQRNNCISEFGAIVV
jgi:hypothetical protein